MNTTEQMNRKELTEARTSNRKVFENQDHSRTVEIYLDPVHYQDTDGSWKEMDDTLECNDRRKSWRISRKHGSGRS